MKQKTIIGLVAMLAVEWQAHSQRSRYCRNVSETLRQGTGLGMLPPISTSVPRTLQLHRSPFAL
jgi:hypothetical protein